MNRQSLSVLLCALLSTTLAHELLAGHQIAHQGRSKHLPHARSHVHHNTRALEDQVCEWICDGGNVPNPSSNSSLHLLVNETSQLVVIVNVTAGAALVIDLKDNIVGLFNGTSGVAIIIDFNAQIVLYITSQDSDLVWIKSKQSIEVYFESLVSLKVFVEVSSCKRFKLSNVSEEVLIIVNHILVRLVAGLEEQLKVSIHAGLTLLVTITKSLVVVLNGTLKGILTLVGKGLIKLKGDLQWLLNVLKGLEELVSHIKGGLEALIKAGVKLNIALLLAAENGIDLLVNLLIQIVTKIDLSAVLGSLLNTPENLLKLLIKLGGDVSSGVDGLLKVVANLIGVIEGKVDLKVLIESLIAFSVSERHGEINISISLQGLLEVIKLQNSTHGNSKGLEGLAKFVQELISGKLVVGGVNISAIIEILVKGVVKGAKHAIELVVTVLVKLSAAIKTAVSIPTLVLVFLAQLNSTQGVELLKKAGIDVKIDVSSNGNIIKSLLKGFDIKKLLTGGFDLYNILSSLPVVGQILGSVSASLQAASGGSLNLKAIFKSSESASISQHIKAFLEAALSINFSQIIPGLPGLGGSWSTENSLSWSWGF
ncbi:uncharacterized protein LOC132707620 [Cylas formicarius]|uniref:uncharacterized protein LOC132707620 n=1 Tax=Cylas formicarius TaxID=197179 RepID=UPI0029585805|nr:uncharacterized protein LOC132707620 [Cylas formicarius]